MRIIIAGGSGQIGGRLSRLLQEAGHEVIVLTRRIVPANSTDGLQYAAWDAETLTGWENLIDGSDAVINLAGENIGGKAWSDRQLIQIENSRVKAGAALVEAVRKAARKPGVLVQASAVGYYGTRRQSPLDEGSGPGDDMLAEICLKWEASTAEVESIGVRRVIARTGLVLEKSRGVLPKMMLPFSFFVGGPLGDGKQVLSWIHIDDELAALRFLVENPEAQGAYNLTAPEPVDNSQFGKAIAEVMKRPYWLPVPAFALKILLGRQNVLVLEGQRVLPQCLMKAGYKFRYPVLKAALKDLLKG
jgi:hypothetical protein